MPCAEGTRLHGKWQAGGMRPPGCLQAISTAHAVRTTARKVSISLSFMASISARVSLAASRACITRRDARGATRSTKPILRRSALAITAGTAVFRTHCVAA